MTKRSYDPRDRFRELSWPARILALAPPLLMTATAIAVRDEAPIEVELGLVGAGLLIPLAFLYGDEL